MNNRAISRNEPRNFVVASEIGIAPGTHAIELEGLTYYCSAERGENLEINSIDSPGQLYSLRYDDVTTNFSPNPESILAAHLVKGIQTNSTPNGSR
ncbi:MAG: hypothetical protein U5K75_00105 [Ahrensia sp.]|nr:hypothetical protein [Ahrensia sp.]